MSFITPDLIRLHREIEAEGERVTIQAAVSDPITTVEQLLDKGATARVLRLTPDQWREMSAHEQRALARWTEQRIKVLSERLCFMRRSLPAEPEVPDFLRMRGAV